MKKRSILLTVLSLSLNAYATEPGPKTDCTRDQLVQAGDRAANEAAKSYRNAVSFVSGGIGISGSVDPVTGVTSEIYYPFAVLDRAGVVIAQGTVILEGNCKYRGTMSGSDVRRQAIQ